MAKGVKPRVKVPKSAAAGDTITIKGRPELVINLKGTNGDLTTSAIAVNAIKNTHKAAPGVFTMRDLPIVSIF